jgi:hypothetical protein
MTRRRMVLLIGPLAAVGLLAATFVFSTIRYMRSIGGPVANAPEGIGEWSTGFTETPGLRLEGSAVYGRNYYSFTLV